MAGLGLIGNVLNLKFYLLAFFGNLFFFTKLEGLNPSRGSGEIGIMEAILESNKSLWKRTGNMALVVVGALSIFLASVEEVHL
jgi:hypothetical protein